jgi:hypothetical protein
MSITIYLQVVPMAIYTIGLTELSLEVGLTMAIVAG